MGTRLGHRRAEIVDRLKNKFEVYADRRVASSPTGEATADWQPELHALLGASWPCDVDGEFEDVWRAVEALDLPVPEHGSRHDGDRELGRAAWCVVRHLRPQAVVETGVARGMTSRCILEAMERNGVGELCSVDLPPLRKPWRDQVGAAVAPHLKARWTYVRGASKRRLPPLLERLGAIDVFIHDSLHTTSTMMFEFEAAWPHLASGGILMADDIDDNDAFDRFAAEVGAEKSLRIRERTKQSSFGILRKP